MKKAITNKVHNLYNYFANRGIAVSELTILQSMYEVATEKKQYKKAHVIMELISEHIN